ncbi:fibronectin type 3 and ankyrin repeat domains protein 1 isoform X1 [Paramormyrops kingsleyae]|uniref:fibronectin type 3 and ankyrin repeat domains protein 1 isoform X1 n=2 Tax=Paramormyrops kingsleyae TaxID=1676925 RepID=UPI003B9796CF
MNKYRGRWASFASFFAPLIAVIEIPSIIYRSMENQEHRNRWAPVLPVIGKVSHHSIGLDWSRGRGSRTGPPESWTRFSLEVEDNKTHAFDTVYKGYGTTHTVAGLKPSTTYKFRIKVGNLSGGCTYSSIVSVSTAGEPLNGKDLHQAVNMNDQEQLAKVLQSGTIDVDVPDRMGFTPVMVAAQKGYFSLVQILVQRGADVMRKSSDRKDSLTLACFSGHLEVVKYLRGCGAPWTSREGGGLTALQAALHGGHLPVIAYMIQDGCEVDGRDGVSGWTPLMEVSAVSGNVAVAALLINAGASVNAADRKGKTPLMVAVLNDHQDLVSLLLRNGADLSVKNEFGSSAAEMARAFDRQATGGVPVLATDELGNGPGRL